MFGTQGSAASSPVLEPSTAVPVHHGATIVSEFPSIVHLNVGGQRLMTTLGTLRSDPESMLGRMFSGEQPVLRDVDGCFVIDRDGRHFHYILNYLRDGSVPIGISRVDRIDLMRE
ncbi:unnamed protein product, partial [Polarella glacialis]